MAALPSRSTSNVPPEIAGGNFFAVGAVVSGVVGDGPVAGGGESPGGVADGELGGVWLPLHANAPKQSAAISDEPGETAKPGLRDMGFLPKDASLDNRF